MYIAYVIMMDIKISVCKLGHPVLTARRCGGLELIPNLVPLIAAGLALHSWLSLRWNGDRDATQTAADLCAVMCVAFEHQPGVCVCVCVTVIRGDNPDNCGADTAPTTTHAFELNGSSATGGFEGSFWQLPCYGSYVKTAFTLHQIFKCSDIL